MAIRRAETGTQKSRSFVDARMLRHMGIVIMSMRILATFTTWTTGKLPRRLLLCPDIPRYF